MRKVAFAAGRFNPPTEGHGALIRKLKREAQQHGVAMEVFVVEGEKSSLDKTKNPLTADQRIAILRSWFPDVRFDVVGSAYEVLDVLAVQGKAPHVWLAGSDRARKYASLLVKEGHSEAQVVEVDRMAGEADGVSATLARKAALDDDFAGFQRMMPSHVSPSELEHIMGLIKQAQGQHERKEC